MNFFSNMSIKARLALFVAIMVVGNVSMLLVSNNRLGETNEKFHEYVKAGVPGKMLSLQIKEDMNYVSRLTRSIMLGDDYQKNMGRLNERLDQIYADFDQLRIVAKHVHNPKMASNISRAVDSSIKDTRAFLEDGRSLMAGLANSERTPEKLQQTWQTYSSSR